jgi:hypothetical protein
VLLTAEAVIAKHWMQPLRYRVTDDKFQSALQCFEVMQQHHCCKAAAKYKQLFGCTAVATM